MAEIPFVNVPFNGAGTLWRAASVTTGDETSVLKINQGNADVSVHAYGTVGGSTVTIAGTLGSTTFSTVDDAYGSAMSYTVLPAGPKPVGPALTALKGIVAIGAGTVTFDVYIVDKVR